MQTYLRAGAGAGGVHFAWHFALVAYFSPGNPWPWMQTGPLGDNVQPQFFPTGRGSIGVSLIAGTVPAGHQLIPAPLPIVQTFAPRGGLLENAAKHAPEAFGFTQSCPVPSAVGGASHGIGEHEPTPGPPPPMLLK